MSKTPPYWLLSTSFSRCKQEITRFRESTIHATDEEAYMTSENQLLLPKDLQKYPKSRKHFRSRTDQLGLKGSHLLVKLFPTNTMFTKTTVEIVQHSYNNWNRINTIPFSIYYKSTDTTSLDGTAPTFIILRQKHGGPP